MSKSSEVPAEIPAIAWDESVWFSDIDYTLIDTVSASGHGSEAIRDALVPHFGENQAAQVYEGFNAIYQLMGAGHRIKQDDDWQKVPGGKQAYDSLQEEIAARQIPVIDEYGGVKPWSREVFIKLAADRADIPITPDVVYEGASAYWKALTAHVDIFPDAQELTDTIAGHDRPLYLLTSSDARLIMGASGQFRYNPAYSEALKRERIELLRERGLRFTAVTIGDPEDKPDVAFFAKAIRTAETELDHPIDSSKAIMLGDSYKADIQTPKEKLGFGLVVLRENHREECVVEDEQQLTTGNLTDATQYLD